MFIEGFVAAVPEANRDIYRRHASEAAPMFLEKGARRMVEAWGDDVPRGEATDFHRAVQARAGEAIVFAWFEYPDRATRDEANRLMEADPNMQPDPENTPFDASRMIYGGFAAISDQGAGGAMGCIDGFLAPVPADRRDIYTAFCRRMAPIFLAAGANRVVDSWSEDLPEGKQTDFRRAVAATPDEAVGFGWIEWPSPEARRQGWEKAMADPGMADQKMPFDGKRMIFGSFLPIVERS